MPSQFNLAHAASVVRAGGIIAYPTEAVFGLGCDPLDESAVMRLLALKKRKPQQGLILIGASIEQLDPYLGLLTPEQKRKLSTPADKPVTWVVPAHSATPDWITGEHNSVAVRITLHPVARALCLLCGQALVSTSANESGQPAARSTLAVRLRFGDALDAIVAGDVGSRSSPATTIIDIRTGEVLR